MELTPSGMKQFRYLNFSISRPVFLKWDFELGSVPRNNGLRHCFVYLARRK